MWNTNRLNTWARHAALLGSAAAALYTSALWAAGPLGTLPETTPPLGVIQAGKPMVMLVASKDHKLFYEAYNDASDIDGDGNLDIRFDPSITYFGLFDSKVCYTHANGGTNTGLFTPSSAATGTNKCSGKWSGNWLNYVTTSRIDALRKVLYGGQREIDTSTDTVLRRAYIPQDTHAWAKEYTSTAVDGYDIADYTPLTQPSGTGTRRHFFGNVTMNTGVNCATPDNCSVSVPPLMSVVTNSTLRVWDWASKEKPVMDGSHGGTRTDYAVRVKVCTGTFLTDCKKYGTSSYKPVGLLHEYGENEAMLFGLLTGSYNKNMSGGVLRQVVTSFKNEVDQTTGQFTTNATIVKNFNALRIRDFNNGGTSGAYRNGSFRTGPMAEGAYVDWGNPVGEMMYEALRYFAGAKAPTSAYDTSASHDGAIGLTRVASWDNPYESTSAAKADWCARPNMLVMSDSYPSYDADQVPGSPYSSMTADAKVPTFNAKTLLDTISNNEAGVKGLKFAGQTTTTNLDYAPSAKTVDSLAHVRGLAPEEPAKLGSYTSSAVAYYGKKTGIVPIAGKTQSLDSYFVTFASPVPTIEIPVNGRTVRVVPFAKTIDGASTNRAKGQYQPTDPIVDVYVREIANTNSKNQKPGVNSGRPYMQYNIIYEADEQGNDFDMDVNSLYTLYVNASNQLVVEVQVIYESTGSNQNIGYVISGSNRDGIYLVAQDKLETLPYFLNTPPTRSPGYCDPVPGILDLAKYNECGQLPRLGGALNTFDRSVQTFSSSATTAASFLKDPLWYAAKWGGFVDRNANGMPDQTREWDADGDGVPDTYFLVQNPVKLREALRKAFNSIYERSAAAGNVAANSTSITTGTAVFQSTFDSATWTGDLASFAVRSDGVSASATWKASQKLPSFGARRIYTVSGGAGKNFDVASLTASDLTLFGPDTASRTLMIDYLRGDRSNEVQKGGTYRNRAKLDVDNPTSSVIGDIVHSSPTYLKDNDTVFVGTNAGMLHAFNASTGVEQFAFIPGTLLSTLPALADPEYKHRYGVDGEIAISDKAKTGNVNYLVGFLGQGGKGLFALDVTTPSTFSGSNYKWANHGTSDADMGYLLGRPTIAKTKSGDNVVIFGNGYNSTNEKAVLYVYKLETGALLAKIDTGVGGSANSNGLSSPGLTYASDGTVEHVYAGDLKGNVWKFDLSNNNPNQWKSAFLSGSTPLPFFTATDSAGKAQPITAQVTIATNDVSTDANYGKRFILFGTGSYMSVDDAANLDTQSLYGLIDEGTRITGGRTVLTRRQVQNAGTYAGRVVRTFSSASTNDMANKSGWYLDWLTPPSNTKEGERVVSSARIYKTIKSVLIVSSIIPIDDPCVPGGRGYVNGLDPYTGAAVNDGIFNINGDTSFADDKLGSSFVGSFDLDVGLPGEPVVIGNRLVVGGSLAKISDVLLNMPTGAAFKGRISWREIVR